MSRSKNDPAIQACVLDQDGIGRVYVGGGYYQEFTGVKDVPELIAKFKEFQAANR